jgi:predicted nucleic acid-binding Zn ribbon protein
MSVPRKFHSLSSEIEACMRALAPPAEAWLGVIRAEWPALVGDAVATRSHPVEIEQHVLYVNVQNHAWLAELRGSLGQLIQRKVYQRTHGDLTRITWRLGSISPHSRVSQR